MEAGQSEHSSKEEAKPHSRVVTLPITARKDLMPVGFSHVPLAYRALPKLHVHLGNVIRVEVERSYLP
jgi:hypothetical protein